MATTVSGAPPGVPSQSLAQEGWNHANDHLLTPLKHCSIFENADQLTRMCLRWELRFIPSLLWDDNLIIDRKDYIIYLFLGSFPILSAVFVTFTDV